MDQDGEWGFIAYFCIACGWRCLSDANRHFLRRRSVSLTTYYPLGPPAVCPSVLHLIIITRLLKIVVVW
jgi:hypothetical protein